MCFASENVPISDSGGLDGYHKGSWSEQDFGGTEICVWTSYQIAWQRKYIQILTWGPFRFDVRHHP